MLHDHTSIAHLQENALVRDVNDTFISTSLYEAIGDDPVSYEAIKYSVYSPRTPYGKGKIIQLAFEGEETVHSAEALEAILRRKIASNWRLLLDEDVLPIEKMAAFLDGKHLSYMDGYEIECFLTEVRGL